MSELPIDVSDPGRRPLAAETRRVIGRNRRLYQYAEKAERLLARIVRDLNEEISETESDPKRRADRRDDVGRAYDGTRDTLRFLAARQKARLDDSRIPTKRKYERRPKERAVEQVTLRRAGGAALLAGETLLRAERAI